MKINDEILKELESSKIHYEKVINNNKKIDPVIFKLFKSIQEIEEDKLEATYLKQLTDSCRNDWLAQEPADDNEKIDALLFEYDCFHDYIFLEHSHALAYGVISEHIKVKTVPYELGFDYDFSSNIETSDGIDLPSLNSISNQKIKEQGIVFKSSMTALDEFHHLINFYLNQQFIIIHKAIKEFVKTDEFGKLNKANIIQFLIVEHDYGIETPLYCFSEDESHIQKAIKLQGEDFNNRVEEELEILKENIQKSLDNKDLFDLDTVIKDLQILFSHESVDRFRNWAAHWLGHVHLNQQFKSYDLDKAIHYFSYASDNNYFASKSVLAAIYYKEEYNRQNLTKTLELLKELNSYSLSEGEYDLLIDKVEKELKD